MTQPEEPDDMAPALNANLDGWNRAMGVRFIKAVPDQIARWVPAPFTSLGTDGYGFSDTRAAARRFFHIDAQTVVVQALQALAERGEVKPEVVQEAFDKYRIDDPTAVRDVKQEGGAA